jgi:hypothetical protein
MVKYFLPAGYVDNIPSLDELINKPRSLLFERIKRRHEEKAIDDINEYFRALRNNIADKYKLPVQYLITFTSDHLEPGVVYAPWTLETTTTMIAHEPMYLSSRYREIPIQASDELIWPNALPDSLDSIDTLSIDLIRPLNNDTKE